MLEPKLECDPPDERVPPNEECDDELAPKLERVDPEYFEPLEDGRVPDPKLECDEPEYREPPSVECELLVRVPKLECVVDVRV